MSKNLKCRKAQFNPEISPRLFNIPDIGLVRLKGHEISVNDILNAASVQVL